MILFDIISKCARHAIAEDGEEMPYLFMDLCFDVLCIYQNAFGHYPSQNDMDFEKLEKQVVLLDTELQSLIKDKHMNGKIRSKPQDLFMSRVIKVGPQMGLVNFMNVAIDDFASESPSQPSSFH